MRKDRYSVAFVADNNYIEHFCVALQSLLINNKDLAFDIYLLNEGLTEINRKSVEKIIEKFDVHFYNKIVEEKVFSNLHKSLKFKHITIHTYFRLFIPNLIDAERVLYLDSDLVVTGSVQELFEIDFEDNYILAVSDRNGLLKNSIHESIEVLGMLQDAKYFNAGVMVINMEKWCANKIAEKVIEFVENNPQIKFADQDGLNAIINGQWKELEDKYNIQHNLAILSEKAEISNNLINEIKNKCIIHFTYIYKPWSIRCVNPFSEEYYKYLKTTPYTYYHKYISFKLLQKAQKNQLLLYLYRVLKRILLKFSF